MSIWHERTIFFKVTKIAIPSVFPEKESYHESKSRSNLDKFYNVEQICGTFSKRLFPPPLTHTHTQTFKFFYPYLPPQGWFYVLQKSSFWQNVYIRHNKQDSTWVYCPMFIFTGKFCMLVIQGRRKIRALWLVNGLTSENLRHWK